MANLFNRLKRLWRHPKTIHVVAGVTATAILSGVVTYAAQTRVSNDATIFNASCTTNTLGYCTVQHLFGNVTPELSVVLTGPTSGAVVPGSLGVTSATPHDFTVQALTGALTPYVGFITFQVAAAALVRVGTVEDTQLSTTVPGVTYNGKTSTTAAGWSVSRGLDNITLANDSYTYSSDPGSYVEIKYHGDQLRVFGIRTIAGGVLSASFDGGPPILVSGYSILPKLSLLYTTPVSSETDHTVRLTITGKRDIGSINTRLSFDRADIYNVQAVNVPQPTISGGPTLPGLGGTSTATPVPTPTATVSPSRSPSPTPSVGPTTSSPTPTSTATSTPTPTPTSTGGGGGGGDPGDTSVAGCPTGDVQTSPGGGTFAGHTYNGLGQSVATGTIFNVGSNTCIENYTFNDSSLSISSGASNVIIVNNVFNNWPPASMSQGRAIVGLLSGGHDITINYNTIGSPNGGTPWTDLFGQGNVTNLTVNHNAFGHSNVDNLQIKCTAVCNNVQISYNKFDAGRFVMETQQVVHTMVVSHNYATVNYSSGTGGQFSIANSNDVDSAAGYYNDISSGIDVGYNIVVDPTKAVDWGDCFESRGPGENVHDNYCWGYKNVSDYAFTSPQSFSAPGSWNLTNNVIVGNSTGAVGDWEGFERSGYTRVAPTETNNHRYGYDAAPPIPSWTYANGKQG